MNNPLLCFCSLAVLLPGISCMEEKDQTESSTLVLSEERLANSENDLQVLGRVLFYDPSLSLNNSVSCASCHKQEFAFADNVAKSAGFDNRLTTRNSMPIQNLVSNSFLFEDALINDGNFIGPSSFGVLFWDGRESHLNTMVMKPIVNHVEMGVRDLDQLAKKIQGIEYYTQFFSQAYGTPEITPERVSDALAFFVGQISSTRTRLDQFNQTGEGLNAIEQRGMNLFNDVYKCNSCHQVQSPSGYLFQGGTFANIGLDDVYEDEGLANISGNEADAGKFKIPSLRNVSLTAPYMHDGRFETLDEVIDHYSTGMADNPNLDFRLKNENGEPLVLEISQEDKQAIKAFLHTLTDYEMINNPALSNPFVKVTN